jgi:hypothetical protein
MPKITDICLSLKSHFRVKLYGIEGCYHVRELHEICLRFDDSQLHNNKLACAHMESVFERSESMIV